MVTTDGVMVSVATALDRLLATSRKKKRDE